MAKEWAKSFYKSKAWLKCRDGYIKNVHGLCERCDKPGWIVHHKEILTPENINDPYITLNWDKLEYLCQDCHNKEHMSNHDKVIRDGLRFNENGDVIKID